MATITETYLSLNQFDTILFAVTGDPSILSVLGARVMLNLKIEGERSLQQGGSHHVKSTILGIEFVVPSSSNGNIRLDGSQAGTSVAEAEGSAETANQIH